MRGVEDVAPYGHPPIPSALRGTPRTLFSRQVAKIGFCRAGQVSAPQRYLQFKEIFYIQAWRGSPINRIKATAIAVKRLVKSKNEGRIKRLYRSFVEPGNYEREIFRNATVFLVSEKSVQSGKRSIYNKFRKFWFTKPFVFGIMSPICQLLYFRKGYCL